MDDLNPNILSALKSKNNILITGAGGVGKTYQTNLIRKYLYKIKRPYAVTASTGLAATHIDGTTLHSFIGLRKETQIKEAANIVKRLIESDRIEYILYTKVIIIDEISMLSADQIDLIDAILRRIFKTAKPFGGLQMIIVGDFFQIPPIVDKEIEITGSFWAFKSEAFLKANFKVIHLKKIIRQTDVEFQTLLNEARYGALSIESMVKLFNRPSTRPKDATMIFGTNREVNDANNVRLFENENPQLVYKAGFTYNEEYIAKDQMDKAYYMMINQTPVDKIFNVKYKARIMIRDNHSEGEYVNGSTGIFLYETCTIDLNIKKYEDFEHHMKESGFKEGFHYKIPTHPNGHSLGVLEISMKYIEVVTDKLARYYHQYKTISSEPKLKIKLDNGYIVYVRRKIYEFSYSQTIDSLTNRLVMDCSFTQYPVSLAWAITSHKSQGCTIDKVYIDFKKFFTYGQAYVAMSRCTSLEGMFIKNFDSRKIIADEHVKEFYRKIDLQEIQENLS